MFCLPSAGRIHEYYSNTFTYFTQGMNASLEKPLDWLEQQDRWARSQVCSSPLHLLSAHWQHKPPTIEIAS